MFSNIRSALNVGSNVCACVCACKQTEEAFYKIYVEPSEQILIRRQQRGVEHRFM